MAISDLSRVIEKDPALAANILRMVNSPFYRTPATVDTIPSAVLVLGFETSSNAMLSISVVQAFAGTRTVDGFDLAAFWRHLVETAVISRRIADLTRMEPPDRCFSAGLLHDIGKLVLCQHFPEQFSMILSGMEEENESFFQVEKRLGLVDHAQVGAFLARHWHLPENLAEGIANHHEVSPDTFNLQLALIVHSANIIANVRGGGQEDRIVAV